VEPGSGRITRGKITKKTEDEQVAEGSPEPQRVHILSETSGLLIKLSTLHASDEFLAKDT
jgi:hypothetical protein